MSGTIGNDPDAVPGPNASFPFIDPDRGAASLRNARATRTNFLDWIGRVDQVEVGAGVSQPLNFADHNGATVVLAGSGATISFSATTQGAGFSFRLINRSGGDWTVPSFAGATREYEELAAHTKVASGGSASFEVYSRGGSLFVLISGSTKA